jgi:multiple sugar transport system substrate-binding protein
MPTCDECEDDPQWLARNSGVVTAISGPGNEEGATYGEIISWAIMRDSDGEAAGQLVEYMMSDGYLDWLAMAPEGKFPVRRGDAEDPERFTEAWAGLEAGVDTKQPLSEIYDAETMEALSSVGAEIDRWAIGQGHGSLLGPVSAQLPIPRAISEMSAGGLTTRRAQAQAQRDVTTISEELG